MQYFNLVYSYYFIYWLFLTKKIFSLEYF